MTDDRLYDHTAEAILFAGIMWWLIKWIICTFTEVSGDEIPPASFTASITKFEEDSTAHAHERDLVSVSSAHAYAVHTPGLPVVAHCPACGFTLTAAPQQLPFTVNCPNCKRHVSVRGDGPGRLSVVVSDPPQTGPNSGGTH